MKDPFLSVILDTIYTVMVHPESNIETLSKESGLPQEVLRYILILLSDSNEGGVMMIPGGVAAGAELTEMNPRFVDTKVTWKVYFVDRHQIPVERFDQKEALVLAGLLQSCEDEELEESCEKIGLPVDVGFLNKGFEVRDLDVFELIQYPDLKKALIERREVHIVGLPGWHEPLGLIYDRECKQWYLMCSNDVGKISTVLLEQKVRVLVGNKLTSKRRGDLNKELSSRFSLEGGEPVEVEVLFRSENNTARKARRRLKTLGELIRLEKGDILFRGAIRGIDSFRSWVMTMGASAEVLQPEWLRDEVEQQFTAILENYRELE